MRSAHRRWQRRGALVGLGRVGLPLAAFLLIPMSACGGSSTAASGAGAGGATAGEGATSNAGGQSSAGLAGSSAGGASSVGGGGHGGSSGGVAGHGGSSVANGGAGGAAGGSGGSGGGLCSSTADAEGCVACCAAQYPGAWQNADFNNECLYCSGSCPGPGFCVSEPPKDVNSTCMQCVQSNWTGSTHCRFGSGAGCLAMVECVKRCPTT